MFKLLTIFGLAVLTQACLGGLGSLGGGYASPGCCPSGVCSSSAIPCNQMYGGASYAAPFSSYGGSLFGRKK
uniref:VM domain-containing protein n=1 Tax=Rhabditophanes sp. KR3021 TaxID=114890 RepID=A0AC35U9K4_9BILA